MWAQSYSLDPPFGFSSMNSESVPEAFATLVRDVVRTSNPQFSDSRTGRTGEADLIDFVVDWLAQRGIESESDASWGVHASVGSPRLPGVLLSAHLDSDHLRVRDCSSVRISGASLEFDGQVGLDDKTGVAICLSVIERLKAGQMSVPYSVHVLFTIGEESGQKGAIRCPLPWLLGRRVRHALVIDRQTRGSGAPTQPDGQPLRHTVSHYKNVPLMDLDSKAEMVQHLSAALRHVGELLEGESIALAESPNNADALEWRGRWDAEVVAPSIAAEHPAVAAALAQYELATKKVLTAMQSV